MNGHKRPRPPGRARRPPARGCSQHGEGGRRGCSLRIGPTTGSSSSASRADIWVVNAHGDCASSAIPSASATTLTPSLPPFSCGFAGSTHGNTSTTSTPARRTSTRSCTRATPFARSCSIDWTSRSSSEPLSRRGRAASPSTNSPHGCTTFARPRHARASTTPPITSATTRRPSASRLKTTFAMR